jgi:CRP/FNR family transcriptional regulator, cyclic AMP receptor protein
MVGEAAGLSFLPGGGARDGRMAKLRRVITRRCSARRSATVRASEPTVVARVSEFDFTRIARSFPSVWRCLAREMADRLRQRVANVPARRQIPRIFIASSKEALSLATAMQSALGNDPIGIKVWTEGIFVPGLTNIESLEAELLRADFALLILSPDDEVISRAAQATVPRDNVILELGLFAGKLGRRRAIMVYPRGVDLKLPTDLLGVNPITPRTSCKFHLLVSMAGR